MFVGLYLHTYLDKCTYIHTHIHAYTLIRVQHAYVHANCIHVYTWYTYVYKETNIHTYKNAYTNIQLQIYTYTSTYMHADSGGVCVSMKLLQICCSCKTLCKDMLHVLQG